MLKTGRTHVRHLWELVFLSALAVAVCQAASDPDDPRGSALYKEMKVSDPGQVFVPPLVLKHVIQLPNPWADPLSDDRVVRGGPVSGISADTDGGLTVETAAFQISLRCEGGALRVVARRKDVDASKVFPAFSVRTAQPLLRLAVSSTDAEDVVSCPSLGRVLCTFRKSDGALGVPWSPSDPGRVDYYELSWSKADGRIWMRSPLGADDHVYGLGMKTGSMDRRGQRFVMWNSDSYGYGEAKDPLYASVPFFMAVPGDGKGCRGVFVDDASDVIFDFGLTWSDRTAVSTANGQLDTCFFAGADMREVLSAYQDVTGEPPLPPVWALGYHQSAHTYFPERRVMEVATAFREKGIPCDALYLDIIHQDQYRPFTWNASHFPDPAGMIAKLHSMGFKVLTIVDPGIQLNEDYPVFNEGRSGNFFLKTEDGKLYANNIWPGYSAFPDFFQERCRKWWAKRHGDYMRAGVDAFKNDMSEPATFNKAWSMLRSTEETQKPGPLEEGTLDANVVSRSPQFGAVPHRFFHNAYGLYESMATWSAQEEYDGRRPFVLMRNTFSSGQRFTYLWTGDIVSDWPSLRMSVQLLQNLNLSGFPVCGADNGGFGGRCTPELYTRWTQFSAFSPFFRTHYFYVEECVDKEPWAFGPETERVVADFIRLRYRLLPYLYTSVERASRERRPLLQPMVYRHPGERPAQAATLQYYWGDDFLVAPVTEPGAAGRAVWLPAGKWYDFWSSDILESKGEMVWADAPLDRIPLFVRAGSIVPMMEPAPSTASFPPRDLALDCRLDASGTAEGEWYADDGVTRRHKRGEWGRCWFKARVDGGRMVLDVRATGKRRFLPRNLDVVVRGLPGDVKTLVYGGRTTHLDPVTQGVAKARLAF